MSTMVLKSRLFSFRLLWILLAFFIPAKAGLTSVSVMLAWDPSSDQSVVGYRIYYGAASRAYNTTVNAGYSTTYAVSVEPGYYCFAATAYTASGLESDFSNEVCTTVVASNPIVISSVQATIITNSRVIIRWSTNLASDSQVEYGISTAYGNASALNSNMVISHQQTLYGLLAGTQYHYRVKSKDASGNLAASGDFTFTTTAPPDTTPPVITNVTSSDITYSDATIAWTTNEASDSQVEYGTSTAYGSITAVNSGLTTSHSEALTALAQNTPYHYRVRSRDAAGNLGLSNDFTFTTGASISIQRLTSNVTFPVSALGLPITWTAIASGGFPPLQYRFYIVNETDDTQTIGQAYGSSNTFVWTPVADATYRIVVWVRSAGSTTNYEAFLSSSSFALLAPVTISSLTSSGTPVCNVPVTWRATASGGNAPLQYRFYIVNVTADTQTIGQAYSAANTFVWTPTTASTYRIVVWVRGTGSAAMYEAFLSTSNIVVP